MPLWLEKHLLPCAFKAFFGIDCPACGAQRSFIQLLHGKFGESFLMYPPLIPVLFLIGLGMLKLMAGNYVKANFLKGYSAIVLAIVLVNYILKLTI